MTDSNPIQNLDSIDVSGERKDGGLDLVIIASSKLLSTQHHEDLLKKKVQAYVDAIYSDAWVEKYGDSSRRIIVRATEMPEQGIINLIGALKRHLSEYGVEVLLEVRA